MSKLPPPFPTTYRNVQKERVETTSPYSPAPVSQEDASNKAATEESARTWAHWLFWLCYPFIGGIISVTKTKLEGDEPRNQAISVLILSIMEYYISKLVAGSVLALFANMIFGADKNPRTYRKGKTSIKYKRIPYKLKNNFFTNFPCRRVRPLIWILLLHRSILGTHHAHLLRL
ncbi:MAG UNVERIFIED_CONTAM: hypothetical protein LVR29_16500 [Microcystis novacekii LVE1205-3]